MVGPCGKLKLSTALARRPYRLMLCTCAYTVSLDSSDLSEHSFCCQAG